MASRSDLIDAIKMHQLYLNQKPGGRRMQLRSGNLSRIKMSKISLQDAILPGANFIQASARDVCFDFCDLFGANFVEADLEGSSFLRADLRGANMARAKLRNANLSGIDLRAGIMVVMDGLQERPVKKETDMTNTDLEGAVMWGADLSGAKMSGSSLANTDLSDANMFAVNLEGADLTGCNLNGAKLRNANLKGAKLTDCNLVGADLSGANLRNVDMTGVDLSQSNTSNSIGGGTSSAPLVEDIRELVNGHSEWLLSGGKTGLPMIANGRNLSGMDFSGLDLSGASFEKCNLRGALFVDTILAMCSMRDADMKKVRMNGAVLDGVRMANADCSEAVFQGVKFGGIDQRDKKGAKTGVVWRADLTDTNFENADLRNSIFEETQMKGTILTQANVAGVAFGDTDLSQADLEGANVGLVLNGNIPRKK
ncbi:pentapeptide repeat-containing protein [Thalassospira lucentensis]|uniref:pentapeptide repeat-containing protein n=1 Tax=Thalassospira lucentensis TaxID=168935 RepID=UPI003D2F064C